MTNIAFKRGNSSNLPKNAPDGSPLWCSDTQEFYIGTGTGVKKIGSDSYSKSEIDDLIGDIETLLQEI